MKKGLKDSISNSESGSKLFVTMWIRKRRNRSAVEAVLTWHKERIERANKARGPAGWATPGLPGPTLDSTGSRSCTRNTGQTAKAWPRGRQETPNNLKLQMVTHCHKNKWEMRSAHRRKGAPGSYSQAWDPGSHHPRDPNPSMGPFCGKCFWTVRAPRPSADTNFL